MDNQKKQYLDELAEKIKFYNQQYYSENQSEISDAEFVQLVQQFEQLRTSATPKNTKHEKQLKRTSTNKYPSINFMQFIVFAGLRCFVLSHHCIDMLLYITVQGSDVVALLAPIGPY